MRRWARLGIAKNHFVECMATGQIREDGAQHGGETRQPAHSYYRIFNGRD